MDYGRLHNLARGTGLCSRAFSMACPRLTPHPCLLCLLQTPCLPLTALMRKIGVAHINLWVLDVEGAELQVCGCYRSLMWRSSAMLPIVLYICWVASRVFCRPNGVALAGASLRGLDHALL